MEDVSQRNAGTLRAVSESGNDEGESNICVGLPYRNERYEMITKQRCNHIISYDDGEDNLLKFD